MEKYSRWLRLTMLLGGLLFMSLGAAADLPPCDTFCDCTRACTVINCQVNGYPLRCGDWGICQTSCYCGGQC